MASIDIKSDISSDVVRSKFSRINPKDLSHLTTVPSMDSAVPLERATIMTVDGCEYRQALVYGKSDDSTTTVTRRDDFIVIRRYDSDLKSYFPNTLKLWVGSIHSYRPVKKDTAQDL